MAKGKNLNPADAFRKSLRKKELKKNKAERSKARDFALVKKDTRELEDDIQKLDAAAELSASDRARLTGLKSELENINKKKAEYVQEHPEQRKLVYRRRRQEKDGEKDDDEDIPMPPGPPPGMQDDSDDDIPMPEGPPPSSSFQDTLIVPNHGPAVSLSAAPPPLPSMSALPPPLPIPEFPPAPPPSFGFQDSPWNVGHSPPPPPGFPSEHLPPPPPGFPSSPHLQAAGGLYGGMPPPPPGFPQQFPNFPPQYMPPPLPHSMPPPPPGFFLQRHQSASAVQDPLSSIPHQTFQAHRAGHPPFARNSNFASASTSATVSRTSSEANVEAATVFAAPQLRDLKKEATSFVPSSIQRKKAAASSSSKINAAPSVGDSGPVDAEAERGPSRPDLLGTLKDQFGHPADGRPDKGGDKKDDYTKFVEEMGDMLGPVT